MHRHGLSQLSGNREPQRIPLWIHQEQHFDLGGQSPREPTPRREVGGQGAFSRQIEGDSAPGGHA